MPSVVMKRSMRIFGARVLRSGRRFCPAQINYKVSAATEPQGWIHLLQHNSSSSGGGGAAKGNSQSEISDSTPMEIVQSRSDQLPSIEGNVDRFVLVYHRKRKRSDLNDGMFGKKYFRKRCRNLKRKKNTESSSSSFCLIAESENGDKHGWLSSFLCSVFNYMCKNADLKVSSLSSLLISNPLSMVFSSHGIDFSWVPSWVTRRSGLCKIYGFKSFALQFSAIPSCFMYLHYGLLLNRSLTINLELPNLNLVDVEPSSNYSNTLLPELTMELPCLFVKKFNRNKTRKRREYVKSEKPVEPVRVVSSRLRRSIPKSMDMRLSWGDRCRANLEYFESDDYLKVNDVEIMLEMSMLRKWTIGISKTKVLRFNFHPLQTMKTCCIIRNKHVITWRDDRYRWKLEFLNKQQWMKFKELYKVCFDRNLLSSIDGPVKVPIFRELGNHDHDYKKNVDDVPFVRPESYIKLRDDELTRLLKKKNPIYEMDSDDEKWLGKYDGEVSKEDFEMIIDASEENLAYYPGDKDASNLYVDLENMDFVEAVFSYWRMEKRKKSSSSALCRIFELNKQEMDRLRMKRVVRKKRTSSGRKRSQPETDIGKDRLQLEEEKKVLQKYEAGKAKASILMESAIEKRKTAQMLMMNADLATEKALEAIRIAEAAKISDSVACQGWSFVRTD